MMSRNHLLGLLLILLIVGESALAAANPYRGRQERSDTFEFAAEPSVAKQGDGFVIRFATKAACDATVMILDTDGRIVRHLASGVLGKNAPAPFKQGTLEQELAWDGKDDFGKPVDASTCQVKVGLGLRARYDRALGWTPGKVMQRTGMAVGRDGRLFVLDGSIGEGGGVCFSVKVYDREGRYLRQIAPPPAHVAGPKVGYIAWNKTAWGDYVPRTTMNYHGTTLTKNYMLGTQMLWQTPVATSDGRFVFCSRAYYRHKARVLVILDGRDGRLAPGGYVDIDKGAKVIGQGGPHNGGPLHMALSPDDKWLYIGSPEEVKGRHGVYRVDMAKPGQAKLFLGKAGKAGKDEKHFNSPRGVACDGEGNIYVADKGNDRVQVFKPDGSFLRSLPVKSPNQLAVNRKTGEVFVLQLLGSRKMKLVKLGGLKAPSIKIQGPEMRVDHGGVRLTRSPLMALDDGSETTYLWLKGYGNRVSRYRDEGAALKRAPAGEVNGGIKGWERWHPGEHQVQIAADPVREELYIREEGMCWAGGMIRVDGRTGKVLDRCGRRASGGSTPFGIENVVVAANGRVYYRTGHRGEWLTCYNPKTKRLQPLPGSRPTGRPKGAETFKGKPYTAIRVPASGGGRTFQDMMGVGLNGDLYIPCGIRNEDIPLLETLGLDYPKDAKKYCNPFLGSLLKVFSADGKLKCLSALPGLGPSQGISAGRDGAVYVALECQPVGAKQPDGLAPGAIVHGNSWGTVVKFDSRTGTYPIGRINGRWAAALKGKPTHRWLSGGFKRAGQGAGPVRIENVLWEYPGFGLFKGNSCNCPKSNLSLDGFERCFVPALHTCTVNVLDANGNVVVRIGGYGNADSRGKDSPVPDPKTGELRPRRKDDPADLQSPLAEPEIGLCHPNFTAVTDEALYVNDKGNYRIVRAALEYHATETVDVP
jgi:hypothetical protein